VADSVHSSGRRPREEPAVSVAVSLIDPRRAVHDQWRRAVVELPEPMPDHDLLTVDDVIAYLRVTRRTVYRWINTGAMPAIHAGRQWRFRRQDVEAWLERRALASPARGRPRRLRVLVVDDDDGVRVFLASALDDSRYEVETVADGTTAVARLDHAPWDLLITDLNMVHMDGLTLVRRARRQFPSLPIIIVTGFSTEGSAIEAVNLGVSGYLTKPFEKAHVRAAVSRALARSGVSEPPPESAEGG
jgi:excisionase family DNA binding protein